MITVTIYRESGTYRGFTCSGHADYAEEGYDIICSAVSVLTVNAVNSIEQFTEDKISASVSEGFLEFQIKGDVSKASKLLLDSMILGLQDIRNNYGNEYITLIFQEV